MKNPPPLLSLKDAQHIMISSVRAIETSERIAIADAVYRVAAEVVKNKIDLPPFDQVAVDGYAFAFSNLKSQTSFKVIGVARAGHPFLTPCEAGECVRVMTGAPLPVGCDTVQLQERVSLLEESVVQINSPIQQGAFVRIQGQEINKNTEILSVGKRLSIADLGVLASAGVSHVRVFCQPKVAVFSIGDELRTAGGELRVGQVFDANRGMLLALLRSSHVQAIDAGKIADDRAALTVMFREMSEKSDVIVTSGGVSVGDTDFVKDILSQEGEIKLWQVDIKPGKPFTFGFLNHQDRKVWFCGLPGNPVSSLVTFCKLVAPMLSQLSGAKQVQPDLRQATLLHDIEKQSNRLEFQQGFYTVNAQGQLDVCIEHAQESYMISTMSKANCFVIFPNNQQVFKQGEQITIEIFPHGLGAS